ncbi:hypothetical protein ACHAWX_006786 [Stephanocyclus meneghinianus]
MKSILHTITIALLLVTSSNSNETFPPTSSITSVATDVFLRTVAPTGSIARVPIPTPAPGSEEVSYIPTSDASFTNYDMQAVEVNGSPIPTMATVGSGIGGLGYVSEGESDAERGEKIEGEGGASSAEDSAAAAAPNTNDGVGMETGLMGTYVLGIVALLGLL